MKKILIVTDAWKPQVNGVVTTMTTIVEELKKKGFHVDVIHPGLFHTFPLPNYPEISVAWNFWDLKKKIQNGGILNDLRKKEFYQSRGTKVRLQKAAGRRRWLKKMEQEQLPQKRW